ncbi:hypothetical protein [Flavobacterium tistrianum]|uniref:hypothetical protein n=1 Tax=Flavobacterium tistrianum TaxID=1685414 RepID=UPI000DAC8BAB|nr:hypothetical protein [Flavobacterium tistrianum]KAF2339978.1 hypothetical protein DMB71_16065 [Flavobacterium tistrianum]
MERNYKISIPEPCSQDWNKMTPNGNGRFCMSCSKTVVDFTSMLPEEIQHYFIQNKNEGVCGRFKNSQLETITIQIPNRVVYSQTNYHKMFLLALFIAMGTTLFSCADKEGNKKKIDQIEIVDNNTQSQDEDVPACYGHQFEPKKTKSVGELSKGFTTGVLVMNEKPLKYDVIFSSIDLDIAPYPKDGMKEFHSYFSKNLKSAKQGEISVLFVIEGDGSLSNFNILKNTTSASEKDIVKVLEKSPEWIPGKLKNRIVRSSFVLPITFK